jgi:electron transfer flavoprotein alpha subunit
VVIGNDLKKYNEELSKCGANKIYLIENNYFKEYNTELYASIFEEIIPQYKPNILLFPSTKLGGDLAPRIAATLKLGLVANCIELKIENNDLIFTRPAYGGNTLADIICVKNRPQLATIRPKIMEKLEKPLDKIAEIIEIPIAIKEDKIQTIVKDIIKTTTKETKSIDEADIIISGGRGVGSEENFRIIEELAEVMDAAVGASRAAVDAGWKPKSCQVGQSGTTVTPNIYVACGISGTTQHLVGMKSSKIIIAINKDPNAPIFDFANYGIVGDLKIIVPLLTEALKKRLQNNS